MEDQSKNLKVEQIADVHLALHVAPTLPAAVIRRNLAVFEPDRSIDPKLLLSMQHQVCSARTKPTLAQLEDYQIGSFFGALSEFATSH